MIWTSHSRIISDFVFCGKNCESMLTGPFSSRPSTRNVRRISGKMHILKRHPVSRMTQGHRKFAVQMLIPYRGSFQCRVTLFLTQILCPTANGYLILTIGQFPYPFGQHESRPAVPEGGSTSGYQLMLTELDSLRIDGWLIVSMRVSC
jgi:hypothetical protein